MDQSSFGKNDMNTKQSSAQRRTVATPSGTVSYVEQGSGPVALFVHGVLMNSHLWRHQLAHLGHVRRCIALDLLAHGHTEIAPTQDVSTTANAEMLAQFLDALKIDRVDLIGNDSGGGIALVFAARHPTRVRSLTLTDCDTHDNWPPEAFKPFLAMAKAGGLADALRRMLSDKAFYRSQDALGPAYERPDELPDDAIDTYLEPLVASPQRVRDLERFLEAFDCRHTVAVESQLKTLQAPTLIVWGTDDVYFDVKWSHWLEQTIPGTRRRVSFDGARLFFPEERWRAFNEELLQQFQAVQAVQTVAQGRD
jgi:pimeloyl-ACP methyl ester carboxylesterase